MGTALMESMNQLKKKYMTHNKTPHKPFERRYWT